MFQQLLAFGRIAAGNYEILLATEQFARSTLYDRLDA
jgi:hypothetical protein